VRGVPDRIAIVTGTSSGIGAAVAGQLLQKGWQVVGIARRGSVLRDPNFRQITQDLSDVAEAITVIERDVAPLLGERRWTRLGLVNNAAMAGDPRPMERLGAQELLRLYALNVVMPTWLMGFAVRHVKPDGSLRIVNVSSGAAVHPMPGLGAYGGSKAALRMAGMILGQELESAERPVPAPIDAAILSYEPGVVDTEMQTSARSHSPKDFPWVGMFVNFKRQGMLVRASVPAAEIIEFLERARAPRFSEARLGG
jgi:benzil reductase ((S)-benzoin forming)